MDPLLTQANQSDPVLSSADDQQSDTPQIYYFGRDNGTLDYNSKTLLLYFT